MAPQVGFEPTTLRLTAECSTAELLRNKIRLLRKESDFFKIGTGSYLSSHTVTSAVLWACKGLTSVFGM